MNNMKICICLLLICICLGVIYSCSVKKYIPEGELLYTGAKLKIEKDKKIKDFGSVRSEIEETIRPRPNSKFLGIRLGLYFYYKAQGEKAGFINRFLNKRIGEKPIYESNVNIENTERVMLNRLENRGFFFSEVSSEINRDKKRKTLKVIYKVKVSEPYLIENYSVDTDSSTIYEVIKSTMPQTLIKKGMRFDLDLLKSERERIDRALKLKGYYNFNADFLTFEADTNRYNNTHATDLSIHLKKDVPKASLLPYKIDQINVFPNYIIGNYSVQESIIKFNNKNYHQGELFFKPHLLDPFILLKKGQYYNPDKSRSTSRRLGSIGTYRFVNIQYETLDSLATNKEGALKANIYLSPLQKRVLKSELQLVTKSNNFTGPGLVATLSNRNLYNGGEILNISGKFGYETQFNSGGSTGLQTLLFGVESELIFSRVLFPIRINTDFFKHSIPKTRIALDVLYQNRSELYSLLGVTFSFGYLWNANRYVSHQVNPISINFLNLTNTSDQFQKILNTNPFIKNSLDQQFIAGLTYSFIFNDLVNQSRRHQFFITSTFDIAGNTVNLLSRSNKFLGLEYSQYAKVDLDVRYHLRLDANRKIVMRFFGGIGVPYGNSKTMPFVKQYFSGGPFSVRAFRIRSLGPGNYKPEVSSENFSFFDQTGNIRLEANIEYRFSIFSFLKGALFADAGNVWNTPSNNSVTGGKFSSDFINELGIGIGFGLRVDIQSFVIRLDLAAPIHTPYLYKGERWDFKYKQSVLNLAVGYPF
ncbi:MAG: BamA/TamA family outer membrane protein [Porphyromonadaceae bacterium]|nr:BamA/TamA family outer membrane protein [Porphyromonadaceae bacterium]